MFQFKSIGRTAYFLIVPLLVIGMAGLVTHSNLVLHDTMDKDIEEIMTEKTKAVSGMLEQDILKPAHTAVNFARIVEGLQLQQYDLSFYETLSRQFIESDPNTFGVGMWLEPNVYRQGQPYFSAYAYRDGGSIATTQEYNTAEYDYPSQPWYAGARNTDQPFLFADIFYDEGLDIYTLTAAAPIYNAEGKMIGVTNSDMDLTTVTNLIKETSVAKTGYAALIDQNGQIIASGNGQTTRDMAEADAKDSMEKISAILASGRGMGILAGSEGDLGVFYHQIPNTNLYVSLVAPMSELMGELNNQVYSSIAIGVAVILILAAILYLFIRYMTRNIKKINDIAMHMADGDFTHKLELTSKDEFGTLAANFNRMSVSIKNTIQEVGAKSMIVSSTAEGLGRDAELARGAANVVVSDITLMSEGAQLQLKSTVDSATSLNELNVGVQRIAESASEVAVITRDMSIRADQGRSVVGEAISNMNVINASVKEVSVAVGRMENHSDRIGEIINVIAGITKQTNLLALNAGIEASRAGEHGRGFGVVAAEIGKLADQSKRSAEMITEIITEIKQDTASVVVAMNRGLTDVQSGTDTMKHVGAAFQHIVGEIQSVNERMLEISSSSEQMSAGSEQLSASSDEMSHLAQEAYGKTAQVQQSAGSQLAVAENVKASSAALMQLTKDLEEVINQFKV
ncbi:methyl-accepting chemotaxis protein [Paenibacillus phyllosphaerae]|uniref:Methyl-accepting chemotaxis protein n=1 Tax=Paenibacillus phyllosphaerae TaxID=274593 RepID=A0A7W5AYL2_9BACL|nr:methyl-accepting chemotaxis protein [Paenibacillus phyllosphaerae]MBB3111127.1 methyl-accepting chemotaxis protein [Paenibacillus phyllosphaerae]